MKNHNEKEKRTRQQKTTTNKKNKSSETIRRTSYSETRAIKTRHISIACFQVLFFKFQQFMTVFDLTCVCDMIFPFTLKATA